MKEIQIKRVALYARVSTVEQAEHGYSIEAQKEAVMEECERRGYKLTGEYVDAGISGKAMNNRPALQQLLADFNKDKFDAVMAWNQSRLSRNAKDYLEIWDKAKKHSIKIICMDSPNEGDTPTDELLNNVKAILNQFERETIVRNVKLGQSQRAQQGLHNGGRALGYKAMHVASQDKKKLVIVESEAVIIKRIFNLYCEGRGLGYIANFLNKSGYRTVRGNTFSYCSIREILDNPLYKGYIRYGRYENWSEKRRKGKNSHPILVKGQHEAIVTEELWNKAALLRMGKSGKTARVYDSDNLLSSILKCPACGSPMVVVRSRYKLKNGTKRVNRYYTCSRFKNKGSVACKPNTVRADKAEKAVMDQIASFLSEEKVVKMVLAKTKQKIEAKSSGKREELKSIEERLSDVLNKKRKLLDLYTEDKIDKSLLDERILKLATEETELTNRKTVLEAEVGVPVIQPTMEYVEKVLSNFQDIMAKTSREQKILLLRLMISKITVKDRHVDKIYLNLGGKLKRHITKASTSCDAGNEAEVYQDYILELTV